MDFLDGCRNLYRVKKHEIEYCPMTPIKSSSGFYSGGDPWTATILETEFDELFAKAVAVLNHKPNVVHVRTMGTGIIRFVLSPRLTMQFLISNQAVSNSGLKEALDTLKPPDF